MYKFKFRKFLIDVNKFAIRFKTDNTSDIFLEHVNKNVERIVLNNLKRRNSLSVNFMTELENKLLEIENFNKQKKTNIRVVILKSSNPTFSGGHDLLEMNEGDTNKHNEIFDKATSLMMLIENYDIPVIVSIQGAAAAAGCQLVASCDIAVCGKSAKFSTPGILAGLFCSTPAVAIGRVLPRKIALEMIYTGEPISAETALRYGLVNHVVEDSEVDVASEAIANKIASLSGPVVKLGKRCFIEQMKLSSKEKAYNHASKVMVENLQLADCKEGIKAFLEKRKPKWNH